ncbi:MAG: 50S ribosomal protein L11 methyltransferase [Rhodospirillaceae bacterium BRH_c57]|nr:MAG: 50S ribosomal protein L11 methyltransferase [Rhodospirillaceae bacterium BRH_c57]
MVEVLHTPESRATFITTHTAVDSTPLLPELRLYLSTEVTPLWEATEEFLERNGVPPPYWAFAWAGGQALARWILDNPEAVAGKRVLAFAAGCGVDAIACARSGAATVWANEIDAFALTALDLNAALNDVALTALPDDIIGSLNADWDIVIAGDVCYERPMAERVMAWLRALVADGRTVYLADPGRNYFNAEGMEKLASYTVPTTQDLEGCDTRLAGVYRVVG